MFSGCCFDIKTRCNARQMLVANNVRSFEGRIRKNTNVFTLRVDSSNNRDNSFIHCGPLRQKWFRSVYLVYN